MQASWTPPATATLVAWRLRWWAQPAAADTARAEGTASYFGSWPQLTELGSLVFPEDGERHCATFVIEDLRSGAARRAETCAERGPLEGFRADSSLRLCREPPNAELTRPWCNLRRERSLRCGTELESPEVAEVPAQDDAAGTIVVASPNRGDDADAASGCQLGGSGSGYALCGTVAAALALLGARRRRQPG